MTGPRYDIYTWDQMLGEFTEQEGIAVATIDIPYSGIRPAFRALKAVGYSCHRNRYGSDPSVLIERQA